MKLISMLAIATAMGGVCAAPALAQQSPQPAPAPEAAKPQSSGFYLGAGVNLYFLDRDYVSEGLPVIFDDQPTPGAFMLRAGYAFNDYVAVEVEAGVGGARQKYSSDGDTTEGEIGIDSPVGAHVVVTLPLNGSTYLLGKAGYVSAKISREYLGVDAPDLDQKGASFGVGGGLRYDSWDYRMEYSFMSGGDSGDGGVLGMFVINHF